MAMRQGSTGRDVRPDLDDDGNLKSGSYEPDESGDPTLPSHYKSDDGHESSISDDDEGSEGWCPDPGVQVTPNDTVPDGYFEWQGKDGVIHVDPITEDEYVRTPEEEEDSLEFKDKTDKQLEPIYGTEPDPNGTIEVTGTNPKTGRNVAVDVETKVKYIEITPAGRRPYLKPVKGQRMRDEYAAAVAEERRNTHGGERPSLIVTLKVKTELGISKKSAPKAKPRPKESTRPPLLVVPQ